MNPLIIGQVEKARLDDLRERAAANPVDMLALMTAIKTPEGKAKHRKQMTAQTVVLPTSYMVTLSFETGHSAGLCRHMSMSVGRQDRVPNPYAVWMVAECLGFVGSLDSCMHWVEQLETHGQAVNVLQPVTTVQTAGVQ